MEIFLNTSNINKPTIEITKSREELFNLLDDDQNWNSPFENLGEQKFGSDKGDIIFAVWLNDNDNRKEPTTPKGMLKRLNLMKEWSWLLKEPKVELVVDDRALIVNLK